ncbi:nuclease-related domain-containing protein [Macrococcus brunensis]|uniref:nuclease-related domain-containing protein n=1 Tax=Macrococcus brunensis TaxID=198483 RepID=UPI001EEFCAB5|nr:nuclease-related domain-containing protein [Macrococcus brunensis]ULG71582.1 NERD domain-containing protein [Macrococcus brunensis]
MFVKIHEPTDYQKFLLAADQRLILNDHDDMKLSTYLRGIEGETAFYELIKHSICIKLWDFNLRYKGSSQYDFLIWHKDTLFHFDIKNFTAHYKIVNHQFVSERDYVHTDVTSQLNKAYYKLETFLKNQQVKAKVVSKTIFINPGFNLSADSVPDHVILPHQIEKLIEFISSIVPQPVHSIHAEKMKLFHYSGAHFDRIHYYPFEEYKQGMRCPKCRRLTILHQQKKRYVTCQHCQHRIDNQTALIHLMKEMTLPKNDALTSTEVSVWSGFPKSTVRGIVQKICTKEGANKNRTYQLK